jgi:hypothetical protein
MLHIRDISKLRRSKKSISRFRIKMFHSKTGSNARFGKKNKRGAAEVMQELSI